MFGLITLTIIALIALFGPFIATHDPEQMNERIEGIALWFGTPNAENHGIRLEQAISDETIRSIVSVEATQDSGDFLAVGNHGFIVRFRGDDRRTEATPTEAHLRGVASRAGRELAVGDEGVILERIGEEWRHMVSPFSDALQAVAIDPNGAALVVGDNGAAAHSSASGAPWVIVATPLSRDLYDVILPDAQAGFVVGARGTLLRWDGGALQEVQAPGFRDIYAIDAVGMDNILAVGERGTVYHFDGESWSEMQSAVARSLRGVKISGNRAAAAATHGDLMLLENGEWQRVRSGYERHFRDVAGDATQFIAVGTDPYINSLTSPSAEHFFGTTHNGRDIYSQVIYGTRTALLVALVAAIMVTVIGTNVGLFAGYLRGKTDNVLMRIVDIMYALPLEPFAMVLVLLTRPGIQIIILAVGLLTWRTTARIIRSQVLSLANRPFVKAAKVAGASNLRIMYVHIAPNVLPLAFLQLAVAMAFAITAEATLSFLGLGPPRLYSWGTILHQARLSGAWRTAWWWVLPPGIMIMLTVVSVFFISRALEVIANPRLAKK